MHVCLISLSLSLSSANALSGVPDGRGGVLPPIKQPVSPTNPYADDRVPFLGSSIGGGGPPPLSIQRQSGPRQIPGPFIGGRPSVTAPAGQGGLPPGIFTGTTPVRPVRQVIQLVLYTIMYNCSCSISFMYCYF